MSSWFRLCTGATRAFKPEQRDGDGKEAKRCREEATTIGGEPHGVNLGDGAALLQQEYEPIHLRQLNP